MERNLIISGAATTFSIGAFLLAKKSENRIPIMIAFGFIGTIAGTAIADHVAPVTTTKRIKRKKRLSHA